MRRRNGEREIECDGAGAKMNSVFQELSVREVHIAKEDRQDRWPYAGESVATSSFARSRMSRCEMEEAAPASRVKG